MKTRLLQGRAAWNIDGQARVYCNLMFMTETRTVKKSGGENEASLTLNNQMSFRCAAISIIIIITIIIITVLKDI